MSCKHKDHFPHCFWCVAGQDAKVIKAERNGGIIAEIGGKKTRVRYGAGGWSCVLWYTPLPDRIPDHYLTIPTTSWSIES